MSSTPRVLSVLHEFDQTPELRTPEGIRIWASCIQLKGDMSVELQK